ncbi:DUF1997 domain-containing protein [Laspinema olomoucense]|uniref:DUF1997 domain-containing protein n=1 Tax=Laspinema olomoucense D3b TaxID=2953688 RepID=A0ABT2NE97_9CYAN|nr:MULTISPECIES: DUF1997 domain-containing protein [unclassified Laspinema]MCT7972541.1 DUF1997 domain-containing protein [Laspinema sp. D3d]MCT7981025.1 DUF1997 domain-containing protein [Laspinema sp. D3b]MCT7988699.1 DUF1997 domain-containing protein [Laspinema sp. D3a]MCT7992727.1 DUF1997 domain-containing protein [Laspinema sp. D3c]
MQSDILNHKQTSIDGDREASTSVACEPMWFQTHFVGCMEMYADVETVAAYFDVHQGWFKRCARPMQADALGENGYALTIGRFGALGYEVEPKIGLNLLPQQNRVYLIETIAIPDYVPPGYDVEFKAAQELVEIPADYSNIKLRHTEDLPATMTRVEWNLDLKVGVCFPKFIHALPLPLVQKTGDRLLAQIVKQVSRRLTYKVQEDFHSTIGRDRLELFKKKRAKTSNFDLCRQCSGSNGTGDEIPEEGETP